ncbi:transposase domain-containing protein [Streptomyces sp. NPDC056387]|uniref:transposase domain-containing protein n=1 Tax=Streptomyces sp. NPDC056387 TaxID=3345803 RepID=UPI0035E171D4
MVRAGEVASADYARQADGITAGILTWAFPPALVDEAVAAASRTEQRSRTLSARTMVYHALAMWLYPSAGHEEVMRRLMRGLARKHGWARGWRMPTPSALAQARQRLGPAPLRVLFRTVAPRAVPQAPPGMRRPVTLDALTLCVPDTHANRDRFGTAVTADRGTVPQVRLVALGHCGAHAVLDAAVGPPALGSACLALELLPSLGEGTLLLAELDALSVGLWRQAAGTRADLLWRAGPDWPLPVDEVLADGSYLSWLAEPEAPAAAPVPVRVIPYDHDDWSGPAERLITTLLAPEEAAADQLIEAHRSRWGLADMVEDILAGGLSGIELLRSRGPDLVEQEIWAMLLVHHAVHGLIVDAQDFGPAAAAGLGALAGTVRMGPPDRL